MSSFYLEDLNMAFLIYIFALAFLSVSTLSSSINPTCEELIKPLDMNGNYSSLMGKWILVEGTSEGIVGMIIQTMETMLMELSPGSSDETIHVKEAYRERGAPEATRDLYRKQAGCLKFPPLITTYNDESELCPLEKEADYEED